MESSRTLQIRQYLRENPQATSKDLSEVFKMPLWLAQWCWISANLD
jgi:hypothetical protein